MASFLEKNSNWLDQTIELPKPELGISEKENVEPIPSTSGAGRPSVSFEESSERTKRRKVKKIREQSSASELAYAAQITLRAEGQKDAAKVIAEVTTTTPTRASRIRRVWSQQEKNVLKPFLPEEALALLLDTKLTKSQYIRIRVESKLRNADIYPNYQKIRAAKKQCYPPLESITISESIIEVRLQELMNVTVSRLILSQKEIFDTTPADMSYEFVLISKWGCDGSTGHSEYKQKSTEDLRDSDIFITSFVPLQLYGKASSNKIILWQNPRPSSVRYCRPIRIQYKKETNELSKEETAYIEAQIKKLQKTVLSVNGKTFFVTHQMLLTMIDGKVCNSIAAIKSAQKCYVCGATPTQMNKLQTVISREVDITTYRFGLSSLHAWIRFFECFLHVSYRLEFKKWQARGEEDRAKLQAKKSKIQQDFKSQLGLLVDHVRPGGSGTTNDGNTARRFFQNIEISAKITGLDEELLKKSAVILQALSSGFKINAEKFNEYALETAKRFVNLYPWFYMPASMHKVLIHGAQIISHALLPIGQLSEEAQESRNKDLKLFRSHTRKTSRENTNEDLLNLLLVSSDPYITSLRKLPQKPRQNFSRDVLELLAPIEEEELHPEGIFSQSEDSEEESYSESEDEDDRL